MKVVNIAKAMIKLQFKLPQTSISRGFTRRTVFHAPAFQQKGINRLMDIYILISLLGVNDLPTEQTSALSGNEGKIKVVHTKK